jgi:hypothetical protein
MVIFRIYRKILIIVLIESRYLVILFEALKIYPGTGHGKYIKICAEIRTLIKVRIRASSYRRLHFNVTVRILKSCRWHS